MAATNRNGGALSSVQARILEFIIRYRDQHGYTPTMREIAEDAGLKAVSSVKYQLDQLDEAGYISTKDGLARGIQILMEPEGLVRSESDSPLSFGDAAHIPLVGRIAAGAPILAEQNIDEVVPVPRSLVGKGDLFMLEIKGDSMIGAGIYEGDALLVDRSIDPKHNNIVIAQLNNEFTVKRLYRRGGVVKLIAENNIYPPRLIKEEDDFLVWGVVTFNLHKLC